MGIFFGTDGIRGIVNDDLTFDLAYKCGNAVGSTVPKAKILIGSDTRVTNSFITLSFSVGALNAGALVTDVGICPTAGIAYLTKLLGFDYGVVISASHNSAEYNGIKIFNSQGVKIGDDQENQLERKFVNEVAHSFPHIGEYTQNHRLINKYMNFLSASSSIKLNGLKVCIDASNGAAYKVAVTAFKKLGAKVYSVCCDNDGLNINNNCGSLYPQKLAERVIKTRADLGIALDGDSDRIIAVDNHGHILDGDIILFMLAKYFKLIGALKNNAVVGTRHTNMGIENTLNAEGIKFIRTDIGDKYVIAKLNELGLSLGGEQSGHIILTGYATTGDGVLAGIKLAEMIKYYNLPISMLRKVVLLPQANINVIVKDKMKVINSGKLADVINGEEKRLNSGSRIMVRVSGTENKIRIMVETVSTDEANQSAETIAEMVKKIDSEV